jgi:LacI family transcriptional regulator
MAKWPAFDLTTIRQPTEMMAREIVAMLLRRAADPSAEFEHRRFSGQLIERGSTRT